MRKEIEALKALIEAQDAEEKARRHVEREREWFISTHIVSTSGHIELPASLSSAIEAYAKALNDLAGAQGIAKMLIRDYEASASETAKEPARKCFDCDDGQDDCHMNCGPRLRP